MPIPVQCEQCGASYRVPDAVAGKRAKCKGCGHVFAVPAAGGDAFADLSALEDLAPAGVGDPPGLRAEPPKPPRGPIVSSLAIKVGGVLGGTALIVVVVLIVALSGGDDDPPSRDRQADAKRAAITTAGDDTAPRDREPARGDAGDAAATVDEVPPPDTAAAPPDPAAELTRRRALAAEAARGLLAAAKAWAAANHGQAPRSIEAVLAEADGVDPFALPWLESAPAGVAGEPGEPVLRERSPWVIVPGATFDDTGDVYLFLDPASTPDPGRTVVAYAGGRVNWEPVATLRFAVSRQRGKSMDQLVTAFRRGDPLGAAGPAPTAIASADPRTDTADDPPDDPPKDPARSPLDVGNGGTTGSTPPPPADTDRDPPAAAADEPPTPAADDVDPADIPRSVEPRPFASTRTEPPTRGEQVALERLAREHPWRADVAWAAAFDPPATPLRLPPELNWTLEIRRPVWLLQPAPPTRMVGAGEMSLRRGFALIDLASGRARAPHQGECEDGAVLDPSGSMVAYIERFGSDQGLHVQAVPQGRVIRSMPLEETGSERLLSFVDRTRVAVVIRHRAPAMDQLLVFDTRRPDAPLWASPPTPEIDHLAVSPGGGHLLVVARLADQMRIVALGAEDGRVLGTIPLDPVIHKQQPLPHALAFSPDGTEFGCWWDAADGGSKVMTWKADLSDSSTIDLLARDDFLTQFVPKASSRDPSAIEWLGDDHLVLDGQALVTRGDGLVVRTYENPSGVRPPFRVLDERHVLVLSEKGGGLYELRPAAVDPAELARAAEIAAAGGRGADLLLPPVVEPDLTRTELLTFTADATGGYEPDPAPAGFASMLRGPVTVAGGSNLELLVARGGGGSAVVTTGRTAVYRPGRAGDTPLQHVDLTNGRVTPIDNPTHALAVAVSPDGAKVALLGDGRVDIHALPGGEHVVGFKPVWPATRGTAGVEDAAFADDGRLLLRTRGELVAWDIAVGKADPVWAMKDFPSSGLDFTPGGTHLVVGRALLDPKTGRSVARLPDVEARYLTFSPDGAQLIGTRQQDNLPAIVVADAATGQELHAPPVNPGVTSSKLQFLDGPYVRSNHRVVDIERGVAVWEYGGGSIVQQSRDPRLWYHTAGRRVGERVLVAAAIPDAGARAQIARGGAAVEPIIGPGTKVSIGKGLPEADREAVIKRLKAADVQVVDQGDLVLTAETTTRQLEERTFEEIGGGGRETVRGSEKVMKLAWRRPGGEVVWSASSYASSDVNRSLVTLDGDKTVQDLVNERAQQMGALTYPVDRVPVRLYPGPDQTVAGRSRLTMTGAVAER